MPDKGVTYLNDQIDRNVIILAGGKSSRMHFPKAWLPYSDKQSVLEHIIDRYHTIGCKQIIVVLNDLFIKGFEEHVKKIESKVIIVKNTKPEKGRIHSLQLGINAMKRSGYTFIHNVDNPDVNQSTLYSLLKAEPLGYARPVFSTSGGHPILVTNGVLENIALSEEDVILRELLTEHSREDVRVDDPSILLNINTPDDYRLYFGKDVPSLKMLRYAALA